MERLLSGGRGKYHFEPRRCDLEIGQLIGPRGKKRSRVESVKMQRNRSEGLNVLPEQGMKGYS